jgi:hypothetical protein
MPRPNDFMEALRLYADDEMGRARNDPSVSLLFPPDCWDDPHFREAWYVGLWLTVKLKRVGVPIAVIRQVCFVNGQHLLPGLDPWQVTFDRMPEIEKQIAERG